MCTPERQASTFTEHPQIVDAMIAHDAAAAGRAMERHPDMVMADLTDFAAAHPDAFELGDKAIAAAWHRRMSRAIALSTASGVSRQRL